MAISNRCEMRFAVGHISSSPSWLRKTSTRNLVKFNKQAAICTRISQTFPLNFSRRTAAASFCTTPTLAVAHVSNYLLIGMPRMRVACVHIISQNVSLGIIFFLFFSSIAFSARVYKLLMMQYELSSRKIYIHRSIYVYKIYICI